MVANWLNPYSYSSKVCLDSALRRILPSNKKKLDSV
jgi:hypothetical protein